jgi:hypothetical protein
VRGLRRAALAVAIGGLVATVLRLRGSDTLPSRSGGWRELGPDDLT